jgi:hypothetical protein
MSVVLSSDVLFALYVGNDEDAALRCAGDNEASTPSEVREQLEVVRREVREHKERNATALAELRDTLAGLVPALRMESTQEAHRLLSACRSRVTQIGGRFEPVLAGRVLQVLGLLSLLRQCVSEPDTVEEGRLLLAGKISRELFEAFGAPLPSGLPDDAKVRQEITQREEQEAERELQEKRIARERVMCCRLPRLGAIATDYRGPEEPPGWKWGSGSGVFRCCACGAPWFGMWSFGTSEEHYQGSYCVVSSTDSDVRVARLQERDVEPLAQALREHGWLTDITLDGPRPGLRLKEKEHGACWPEDLREEFWTMAFPIELDRDLEWLTSG